MRVALWTAALGLLSLFSACAMTRGPTPAGSDGLTVRFTYQGHAEKVCLRGDFNHWSPDSHCLTREGPVWRIDLVLTPGRYRYAFFLDDERWLQDPNALFLEDDGFGRRNSVVIVE